MASRKNLKKSIKGACGELFADCVALSMCGGANQELLLQLEQKIVDICSEYVSRISHTQKGAEKLYYKKLINEFTAAIDETAEAIIKA